MLQLLNDVLDLGKLQAGRMEIQLEPVEIRPLLEQMGNIYGARATEKGVQLAMNVDSTVSRFVLLDRRRLMQILGHLMSNAVKVAACATPRPSLSSIAVLCPSPCCGMFCLFQFTACGSIAVRVSCRDSVLW